MRYENPLYKVEDAGTDDRFCYFKGSYITRNIIHVKIRDQRSQTTFKQRMIIKTVNFV